MEAPGRQRSWGGIDAEMGPALGSFEAADLADDVELDGPARRSFEAPTTWRWGRWTAIHC